MILIIIALLLLLIVVIVFLIAVYNSFVTKRNMVDEALSGIDIMLKKRYDLIPNLVETIKGYTTYEKETLLEIVSLRNQARTESNGDKKMKLDTNLSQAVTKIFALAEAYPDLKANTNFQSLQTDLATLETDIERSKRYYNGTVRDYNIATEKFPSNLIAGAFGFQKKNFLEINDTTQRETPKIQF
ncbi:Protein LemA [Flavobacterium psychrophilum]|uniref:LemA family protein n=1 Tax=Flavobacterium psychrophilum TaxID=96345 RepID=UPI000B7C3BE1|nr:LemA family protein [Flavobacterium psychrophilum]SNB18019.1 Protein LemA [Flavobacterium psychrophilum]